MVKEMSDGVEKIIEQEKSNEQDIDDLGRGENFFFQKFLWKVLLKHIYFDESQDIEIN